MTFVVERGSRPPQVKGGLSDRRGGCKGLPGTDSVWVTPRVLPSFSWTETGVIFRSGTLGSAGDGRSATQSRGDSPGLSPRGNPLRTESVSVRPPETSSSGLRGYSFTHRKSGGPVDPVGVLLCLRSSSKGRVTSSADGLPVHSLRLRPLRGAHSPDRDIQGLSRRRGLVVVRREARYLGSKRETDGRPDG